MNGNTFWLSHRLAKAALTQWFNHLATPYNQTDLSSGLVSFLATTVAELIRTQLLHDAMTVALAGHLNTVVALNMTNFLKKEQSPVIWRTFYPLADRLRKQFEGTDVKHLPSNDLQPRHLNVLACLLIKFYNIKNAVFCLFKFICLKSINFCVMVYVSLSVVKHIEMFHAVSEK